MYGRISRRYARVVRSPDGSLLAQDSETHRNRNLVEELGEAWQKLEEGDVVQFSFRHTQPVNVHTVNGAGEIA